MSMYPAPDMSRQVLDSLVFWSWIAKGHPLFIRDTLRCQNIGRRYFDELERFHRRFAEIERMARRATRGVDGWLEYGSPWDDGRDYAPSPDLDRDLARLVQQFNAVNERWIDLLDRMAEDPEISAQRPVVLLLRHIESEHRLMSYIFGGPVRRRREAMPDGPGYDSDVGGQQFWWRPWWRPWWRRRRFGFGFWPWWPVMPFSADDEDIFDSYVDTNQEGGPTTGGDMA